MYTRKVAVPKLLRSRAAVLLNAVPARPAPLVSVVPDELAAGRTAAATLLDAGHRSGIYLIGAGPRPGQGPAGSLAAVERLQGIKTVLDEAGVRAAGAIACTDWEPELGHAAVRKLLDAAAPIKALVCFNDRLAVGAYTALAESGLAVASDVSVISFDDDPISKWVKPELTTIAIPHYDLGRRSIELLLDGPHAGSGGGLVERVPMPLRLRRSVAAPAS
jgi:LacI family transcriptional regulator